MILINVEEDSQNKSLADAFRKSKQNLAKRIEDNKTVSLQRKEEAKATMPTIASRREMLKKKYQRHAKKEAAKPVPPSKQISFMERLARGQRAKIDMKE